MDLFNLDPDDENLLLQTKRETNISGYIVVDL